jgi:hypothetical protein
MLAWLAAALFFIAFLISGGDLQPSTAWTLAVLHAAGGPPWRRGG